jgi:hypothetical protein
MIDFTKPEADIAITIMEEIDATSRYSVITMERMFEIFTEINAGELKQAAFFDILNCLINDRQTINARWLSGGWIFTGIDADGGNPAFGWYVDNGRCPMCGVLIGEDGPGIDNCFDCEQSMMSTHLDV